MRRCLILLCLTFNLSAINITKVAAGTTILVNVLAIKDTAHKIKLATKKTKQVTIKVDKRVVKK